MIIQTDTTNRAQHWNHIYETKTSDDMSWYQTRPALSLKLIEASGVGKDQGIIDVGGGTSSLVDYLLEARYGKLAVLDISPLALEYARQRLGERAGEVEWIESDVTAFRPPRRFSLWHDRAVFHFLTDKTDRQNYVESMKQALTPEGQVIMATFAPDGPPKCSGLDVVRYDAQSIRAELGAKFQLLEQANETHTTPWGTTQKFNFFRFAQTSAALP